MPANTSPIFTLTPNFGKVNLVGNIALATSDGAGTVGTTLFLLLTAGNQGSLVSRIRFHPYATAAATATAATVYRIYVSSVGASTTTAANTFLIQELSVGAMTAAHSTTALTPIDVPLGFALQSGLYVLVSTHANFNSSTGCQVTCIAGDY